MILKASKGIAAVLQGSHRISAVVESLYEIAMHMISLQVPHSSIALSRFRASGHDWASNLFVSLGLGFRVLEVPQGTLLWVKVCACAKVGLSGHFGRMEQLPRVSRIGD